MTTRKATQLDIAFLAPLFDAYRVFYQKASDVPAAAYFLEERISRQESEIFVALDAQGQMAGFTQLYPLFSSTRMKRLWLLNDLYVAPAFRGQGLSVALIEAAKAHCRETNEIGNILYPRTGFTLDIAHNCYAWDNG